jgi:Rrf2 family protein
VITREADYALRAVLELAAGTGGRSAAELARATQVPYPFMRRVLARLTAAGLVRSLRGRSGGVRLTRPATDLSLLEVLSVMDADTVTLNACLREGADCARSSWCAAHAALAVVLLATSKDTARASPQAAGAPWPRRCVHLAAAVLVVGLAESRIAGRHRAGKVWMLAPDLFEQSL